MKNLCLCYAFLAGLSLRGNAIFANSQDRMAFNVQPMRPANIAAGSKRSVKGAISSSSSSSSSSSKKKNIVKRAASRVSKEVHRASHEMSRMMVFVSLDVSGPTLPGKMLWATRPGLIKKRNMLLRGQEADGLHKFCADPAWGPQNQNQRCANMPNNTLVKVSRFGYCETMNAPKNCTYVAMMQDPVASTVQSYNRYCLGCGHQGLFCNKKGNGCPNVSILDWAKSRNNILTRAFATKVTWADANTMWTTAGQPAIIGGPDFKARKSGNYGAKFLVPVSEDDFRRALRHVRRPNVQPVSVEELNIGQRGRSNGLTVLSDLLGTPIMDLALDNIPGRMVAKLNSSMQKLADKTSLSYLPTESELQQIQDIMKYDILMYKALFGKSNEAR